MSRVFLAANSPDVAAAAAQSADVKESQHAPLPAGRFRGDVEGLRAVAVGLVLLYHAGLPFIPSGFVGVDVFFVISGFLITTQLVSELERTGRVSLSRFYARRAKRILPAAAVVLAATVVLVRLVVPKIRWEEIGGDIISSALYVVNWRLADRSVDYLAEDSQPSPVQHFWSLAVEEQFYFVWPLMIILAGLTAKTIRKRAKPILWAGLAVVAVPSFAWALAETAHSPESAFFVTTTRMWELAIGAAVAVGAGFCVRLPRRWAVVIGWAGVAAVAASGVLFTARTPWPGYAAAFPTIGAAAVIVAGFSMGRGGPASLLDTRPFRWVGRLSYSLYLWHWPLLVAAAAYWGELSATRGLVVAIASVVPAWLTYRLVENPLRYSPAVSRSPRLALSLGANFTLAGVVAGLVLLLTVTGSMPGSMGDASPQARGAAVLSDDPRDDPAGRALDRVDFITPDPLSAVKDVPDIYRDGCHQNQVDDEVLFCTYGDPASGTTVAVAGDSKVAQWLPALQILAEKNGWKLLVYTKSACAFSSAVQTIDREPYNSCVSWNRALLDGLIKIEKPDYLITSQGAGKALASEGVTSVEAMVDGMRRSWSALTATGTKIIVVADNPHPDMAVYECVEEHRNELSACTYSRDRRTSSGSYSTQLLAVEGQANVKMIDLFDAICPTEQCSPVIGNVLIYRQGSHITATYVRTLTPRLADALTASGLAAELYDDGQ